MCQIEIAKRSPDLVPKKVGRHPLVIWRGLPGIKPRNSDGLMAVLYFFPDPRKTPQQIQTIRKKALTSIEQSITLAIPHAIK
jgi:hypothetical protein